MPRFLRPPAGGMVCHVLNRANARLPLFERPADYELFEQTLEQGHQRVPMRTLAFCVMPNHGTWCSGREPTATCRSSCDG
jgi:putative transposase